ncbi:MULTISPECIES: Ger(x)C family spore germination protein [Cytobacillus]|uniref:Ger(x)C family spore germination protein n=1 Tax=Cytobacillus TaxID=2675230 RepID=UPI00203F4F02|nr:Ger(x)C family spore germination protein [Cytobacillus firmus]MCM3704649.1 Ger(x)C family spore germination protein [Cytobacillus firmus]
MRRRIIFTFISFFLLILASGCENFVEPNQLAFVIGTALDHDESGVIEVSHQIVIPSQISGSEGGGSSSGSESFIVLSAKGKDIIEANRKIQRKMSRRLMENHRILIALSEELFEKHDVSQLFDKLNRDPANNLRDITIMIKGGNARDFLMQGHPMDHLSSVAAGKEMKLSRMSKFTSKQLAIDILSDGYRPLIPVFNVEEIQVSSNKKQSIGLLSGFAVMNKDLKVSGILDDVEGSEAAWMAGKRTFQGITIPWKDGKGALSFRFSRLKRQIHSVKGEDPNHIILTVKAQAYLLENTTPLDLYEVENIVEVQKYLNEQVQKELQQTVDKVQELGPDVFGIGEHLHREFPYWWKSQKDEWDDNFKETNVTVKAKIRIRSLGTSGKRFSK